MPRSVGSLFADDICALAGIESRFVDCVLGGVPCPGIYLIGHHALYDPRSQLVRGFVREFFELGARASVFENVKGLVVGKQRAFLDELVRELDRAGYRVLTPVRVLSAAHFRTPKLRERLILARVLKGHRFSSYPAPTPRMAGKPRDHVAPPFGPNYKGELEDLPDADDFAELLNSDKVSPQDFGRPSESVREFRCQSSDPWHIGHCRDWDPSIFTASARTWRTTISRRRFAETYRGTVEPISRLFRLPALAVSNTMRAGWDGPHSAFTGRRPIRYQYPRCVKTREMACLRDFQDRFRCHVANWHGARQ
ncbi:MAG: DNA cytosine methyltransferase, partial [Boseongicola sp.]|nr:DNA cytosine methyltransferase [Boseongicola sp.]